MNYELRTKSAATVDRRAFALSYHLPCFFVKVRIVYKKFVHYFPKVNTTVMKESGHRFFLSIPVQPHLADATRRYPDLGEHIREASKWGPAHVTIAMFESCMPIGIVTRTLTETLS